MQPNDTKYHDVQSRLIESKRIDGSKRNNLNFGNLKSEREKWNFINKARNFRQTCTVIHTLKNAFGDCVSEPMKSPKLANYRFSKVGEYLSARNNLTYFLDDQEFTNL